MNNPTPEMSSDNGQKPRNEPVRKSIVFPLILAGAAVVVLAVVFSRKPTRQNVPPENAAKGPTGTPAVQTSQPPEGAPAIRPAPGDGEVAVVGSTSPPAATPASTPQPVATKTQPPQSEGPAPSPYTRQLMQNLTSLDLSKGLSPEKAGQWKQEFEKLVKEGAGAVPAIREFLAKNVDLGFEGVAGGDQLGASSLRLALFSALQQIGGAEAIGLAAQTLQTTADPREIAVLARTLDQMDPAQHRDAAVAAAREALALAAKNIQATDVSPLFEVLSKYGGATVGPELEQAAARWNYYAPLALASLPDGAGVASLVHMAQDPEGTFRSSSRFALQMLAQLAPQNPDAAKALLEQVSAGKVPDTAWYGIASALEGTRMFPGTSYFDSLPASGVDPKVYSIPSNRQTYRSYNYAATWSADQIQQQLALIDQFRAANPTAAQVLERARANLAGRLNK